MQDIRKPYTRSKSNQGLASRVEAFESRSYAREVSPDEPVRIPLNQKRSRRNLDEMDMYPRRSREEEMYEQDESRERRPHPDVVFRDPRTRYSNKRVSLGTWAFIGTVGVLVVGAFLMTYVFDSATVTITPKHADIDDFRKAIILSKDGSDVDTVPFVIATSSLSKSKTLLLSETKKVEAKASGKIIVYNNFDTSSQKLIKNTRFESSAGKIYRINQSITVPPKKGDTPGSVEVTVYADSYGTEYNSAPTDFTIPGFKGTPRAGGFFARSDGPLSGGSSGNVSLASLSDMNAAKDELALELRGEIKTELLKAKKDGYIGLYSAIEVLYDDNQSDILQGTTAKYEVTATGYLMFADAKALAKVVAADLRDYGNEPVRLGFTDTLNYTRKDTEHIATSPTLSILVEGKPRVIWVSDEESIKKMVIGKKRDEFKPLMKTITSIEGAEIGFSPLWLSSFPNDVDKISIIESLPKR